MRGDLLVTLSELGQPDPDPGFFTASASAPRKIEVLLVKRLTPISAKYWLSPSLG